jgi:TRAP-type C4-dicarboxylate transport system substrate-binding protein
MMKFGHVAPPVHAQHKAAEYFSSYIEKESNWKQRLKNQPKSGFKNPPL